MKSIKLNKQSRQRIIDSMMQEFEANALKSTGFESREVIKERRDEVEQQILVEQWDKLYGKYKPILDQLPDYLKSGSNFTFDAPSKCVRHLKDKSRPGKCTSGYDIHVTDAEYEEVFKPVSNLTKIIEDLDKQVSSFRSEISVVIESVNTTKQLVELWPAAEAYIPADLVDPQVGINLPALPISRLEARLRGLA